MPQKRQKNYWWWLYNDHKEILWNKYSIINQYWKKMLLFVNPWKKMTNKPLHIVRKQRYLLSLFTLFKKKKSKLFIESKGHILTEIQILFSYYCTKQMYNLKI